MASERDEFHPAGRIFPRIGSPAALAVTQMLSRPFCCGDTNG